MLSSLSLGRFDTLRKYFLRLLVNICLISFNTYCGILILLAVLGTICLNWLIDLLVFIKLIIAQRASPLIRAVSSFARRGHEDLWANLDVKL
jgi:hypothetical protein